MAKTDLNKLRQTKEYFTEKYFTENVDYTYVSENDRYFKEKVIELRKDFPNDREFGSAVAQLLHKDKNPDFPGVQNL